jgi:hypothetical protein
VTFGVVEQSVELEVIQSYRVGATGDRLKVSNLEL